MLKIIVFVLLAIGVVAFIINRMHTYKVRTVLACYGGYRTVDMGYRSTRGTDSKAYYDSNTGTITFRAGTPGTFEKITKSYYCFSTPKGKDISFDGDRYSLGELRSYDSYTINENVGKYGILKYNLDNRVKFEIAQNQTEAKREFDRLKAEHKEKMKNNFLDDKFSVFILSLIMAVSVCLMHLASWGMEVCAQYTIIPAFLWVATIGVFIGQLALLIFVNSELVIDGFINNGAFSVGTKVLFYILGIALGAILSLIAENCFNLLLRPIEDASFALSFIVVGVDTAIIVFRGIVLIIGAIMDSISHAAKERYDRKWK